VNHLAFREKVLVDTEKQLATTQLWERVAACKRLEELQAAQATGAQKVWDFLGQTHTALVPLGFSPPHFGEPVQEVSIALSLLDFVGAKMLKVEEVVGNQLEAEGHILVEKVAEHVLTCLWSRDPIISMDLVVLGPIAGTYEASSSSL
jgi:hypothetical protein